jgi:hypothetical protein
MKYPNIKLEIVKATAKGKKWRAIFTDTKTGKQFSTNFGGAGYIDYTLGATDAQRDAYRKRHAKDNLNDPFSAGSLSMEVLWSVKDIKQAINAYAKKYGFNI